ncbi:MULTISPECIES: amidohydrolase family protein [unclassified Pseudofrankia]|uniref:amidohydrolase family protein n=1 Tax=unclassified Pseudofrankia TaxID=2994372 RepID=UPI0008D9C907|nr:MULTISPECIES: amidohydrolase family protein [unclassified Pseudofrankia]MDT3441536.1 amidohydrolase family protein [Pseudofrankia sp. BMG5.37]OHV49011.1 amidohydrolase [Pseudofrankia sp. BMG5.36]
MLPESARIMSADDHLIEPAHLWVERVPARFRDGCPRIVEVDGRQAWLYEGELTYIPMGSCRPLPGFSEAGYPPAPGTARFDEIRPGCYDPDERLKDMDIDGVWGQLCFPNYARFAGHRFFLNVTDPELALACLRTYNDYLLDEWCATDRDRLFGAAILPLHDLDAAVAELKRVLAKGARAIAFSENPTVLGLPSVHTDHWDPLWAVANDAQIPVCMHIGSSSRLMTTSADAPPPVLVALIGVNSMMTCVDWLFSGILERFARLQVILSEGGAGWVPYILERAEKAFHDNRIGTDLAIGQAGVRDSRPPREVFAQHMYACLVDERFALRSLGDVPVDNLLFEGDYPHGDGLWPNNRAYLEKTLADVPDSDAVKIAETNLRALLRA